MTNSDGESSEFPVGRERRKAAKLAQQGIQASFAAESSDEEQHARSAGARNKAPAGIRRDEATKPETREYSKVGTTSIVPKSERKQSDNEVFLGRKPSATIIGERIRDRGGYRRRIGSASRSQGKLAGNRDQ